MENHKGSTVELFAGAGGLALGLEKAGFEPVMLNEVDKHACNTLRENRPQWEVHEGDIREIDFRPWQGRVDVVSGGFPCQSFSTIGNKAGFNDTRGTLFFEFARAIRRIRPKLFIAENVRGLATHNNGQTLNVMKQVIDEIGYDLIKPRIVKAVQLGVPQKRERLILVGVRKDMGKDTTRFRWPLPWPHELTLRDALKAGELYSTDVPESEGQKYSDYKASFLAKVPPGGCWRNLSEQDQKEYLKGSWLQSGGKTGMARRLSWNEPSLTLTCSPAQKQTERCHPDETRPLTVREYARIQTFPDDWYFSGPMYSKYAQIGNAVPVNMAFALGKALAEFLD